MFPILFEPNHAEAERLRLKVGSYPKAIVMNCALGGVDRKRPLFITRNPTCISILEPNFELLKNYGIAEHFQVIRKEEVECCRYDTLWRAGAVPACDVLKIDVQGYEYEMFLGFGACLQGVLGIVAEAHFYEHYRGQRLLHDIVRLASTFGLVLRRIDSNKLQGFNGDFIEIDAFFTIGRAAVKALDKIRDEKFSLMSEAWGLPRY